MFISYVEIGLTVRGNIKCLNTIKKKGQSRKDIVTVL